MRSSSSCLRRVSELEGVNKLSACIWMILGLNMPLGIESGDETLNA